MNVFPQIQSLATKPLRNAVLALMFLMPAALSAQEVAYTAPGIISVGGVAPLYNQEYVLQKTDFGFLWLNTTTLTAGLIQVEAKCGVGQPGSDTGIYVIGDCNGITSVKTSGNTVLAFQYNGQCGAATQQCNGSRVNGTGNFGFRLGTWEFLGQDVPDIADSTQTADLLGRTWIVQSLGTNGRSFNWKASGNPSGPPTAGAGLTNLSAAGRTDKTNYYGDKWQLSDASTSSAALTRIDWDFNYNVSFAADETGPPASEASVTGYFPCDPAVQGNIRTGASCMTSVGLTNPPATGNYRLALQSANVNGTSAAVFVSSPVQVFCPQVSIVGYAGFSGTCVKSGGTMSVLTGGNANASASSGNLAEATPIQWDFTGSTPISVLGANVPVPSGATGFTLTITYPGGYRATAQGTVVQAPLVAAFALAPNPVLLGSTLTFTNQMLKAATTTLNSVDYAIAPGACGAAPAFTGQLAAGFLLAAGGTAGLTAPSAVGGYCAYLRYNYTPAGSQTVSKPFTATDWTASPAISMNPFPLCGNALCPQIGTQYTLSDAENILVSPHPAAQWDLITPAGNFPIGSSADANVAIIWTPSSTCTSNCVLRLTVNGAQASLPVTISPANQPTPIPTGVPTPLPTPPGGGGGGVTVSVSGPTTGARNVPLGFTAFASGGAPPYNYSWACNYNAVFPTFSPGSQTQTCSYPASGSSTVVVKAQDALGASGFSSGLTVTITGLPAPNSQYTVAGAALNQFNGRWGGDNGTPIIFTANETNAASYSWDFGDGTSATTRTTSKTFNAAGSYAVILRVGGDEITTSGTVSTTILLDVSGPPRPSAAYTISGATLGLNGRYSGATGAPITFTATESNANVKNTGPFMWDLGDGRFAGQRSITVSYPQTGPYKVKLTVYGDGTNKVGESTATLDLDISAPAPSTGYTVSGAVSTGANSYEGEVGRAIVFTATGPDISSYTWELGDGTIAGAKTVTKTYNALGVYTARLTVTGNGNQTSGTRSVDIAMNVVPVKFRAMIVPGAARLDDGNRTWGTDLSVTNGGEAPLKIGLAFVPYSSDANAPSSQDLSQLNYGSPIALAPGGSYSTTDVVGVLNGGNNQGTLVIKYEEGTRAPFVTSRVYFQPKVNPGNLSYGSGLPVYEVDGSGGIQPQGFVSTALSELPGEAEPDSAREVLDLALSVTLTGNGSGTVTSDPEGINCPTTCSASFPIGTYVLLRSSAAAGSISAGITPCDSQPLGQCAVLMNAGKSVTARFDASSVNATLSVIKAGTGTGTISSSPAGIICGATCSAQYATGTTVTLSAVPDQGSTFSGWSGACSGNGTCTVPLSASASVTGTFTSTPGTPTFTLSVVKTGTGAGTISSLPAGISCGATCSASFTEGTSVTLAATPNAGSKFSGWGGDCSGTGTCVVALSANKSVAATFAPATAATQGDQVLIGLRSDARSRFVVTLYNAGGSSGDFELRATDDKGVAVVITDGASRVPFRKFTLRPYQQVYLRDSDLTLDDGRHYVLKATKTSADGTLLAFGTSLDKYTNDLVQVTDDSQASATDTSGFASYWVAGVSRYDSTYGAHWRTDLRIFNRGSNPRNLSFEYTYLADGVERVAHVDNIPIARGELLTWDDVVGSLLTLAKDKDLSLSTSNAGILRIYYVADDESKSRPLMIGSRNYDDQPTGTVGSQLPLYTAAQAASASQKLYLTGVEESDRYRSLIGFFTLDPGPVTFRVTVLDEKGNEVGALLTQLGGNGGHWGQLDLTSSSINFQNPGKPVSIRVDQINGGRLSAYAFTVDKVTLDTNFTQGIPQN